MCLRRAKKMKGGGGRERVKEAGVDLFLCRSNEEGKEGEQKKKTCCLHGKKKGGEKKEEIDNAAGTSTVSIYMYIYTYI